MNWEADSVQAVIFTPPGVHQDDAMHLWAKLFPGDTPDGFQKSAASTPTLTSSASGERDGYAVSLNAQVGRIDIILNPTAGLVQAATPEAPPRLADVPRGAATVSSYAKRLSTGLRAVRFAVVLDLAVTIEAGKDGEMFAAALPQLALPSDCLEPSFQLNQRRSLTSDAAVRMNRICAWSIGMVGFMQGFPGPQVVNNVRMSPFLGFKVDVNTAPEDKIADNASQMVIDELLQEALGFFHAGYAKYLNG